MKSLETKIDLLERAFLNEPQVPCPVVHRFGQGIYIREVKIPAGTYAIGHHQNFEHVNILLKGRVSIRNDDGSFSELRAPYIYIGKPGRKIGYIHEDMTWINIYSTEETDVEKLETHYLTKSLGFKEMQAAQEKLALLGSSLDREDFDRLANELGLTKEEIRSQAENEADMTDLPGGEYKFKVGNSRINDRGLIAVGDFEIGEKIGPARIAGLRTIVGRYTNHSMKPNAKMVRGTGSDIDLIAIQKINGCRGGMDGDEITVNYRDVLKLNHLIGKGK